MTPPAFHLAHWIYEAKSNFGNSTNAAHCNDNVFLMNFRYWLHQVWSKWQCLVKKMMTILSKWRHFRFIYYTILLLECLPYSLKLHCDMTLWVPVSIGSDYGWVPCSNKPLSELIMTEVNEIIWCHVVTLTKISFALKFDNSDDQTPI